MKLECWACDGTGKDVTFDGKYDVCQSCQGRKWLFCEAPESKPPPSVRADSRTACVVSPVSVVETK